MSAEVSPLPKDTSSNDARQRASGTLQQLSHDIRSAMSDVLGGIRLVETARLDAQTQTQIDRIRAAADTLAALVDDCLLTASGETVISTEFAVVMVAEWVRALDRRWSGRAAERGSRFAITQAGDLPERLNVSAITLDRIVGNLVGNALMHAAGGDVRVEVSCEPGADFEIRVKDQGPGLPAHVLRDGQGPQASTAGSGLGLRIVRELSAVLPASLTLSNLTPAGHGCASLKIPSVKVDWTADGPVPVAPPDLEGLRVLVAEDNLTNQTILRQMLAAMNAETVFVADGVAAMDALESEDFDIGLIDIEMPRMSGLEVMEQVRATPDPMSKMPLVAITAYVLRDNREAIYAAGADGIIGKPIASSAEFGRTILRHVGRPAGGPDSNDVLLGQGLGPQMDHERLDCLLETAGAPGSAELLERVLEDLTAVLSALDDGVAKGSVPDIRAQTHILIAISGAVGADRLCQMAEVLNIAAKRKKLAQLAQIHGPLRLDLVDLLDVIATRRAELG
ncbi:response regulator [Rhodobacteraceae bacterium N5(2021)]|uniref:Response regulator n=1 Tax=Gymnodinialimonas phycosphaerae TaxID=2841589 RepID=A0A975YHH6_9RHOB|nr:response regulator [Gymnodinialimonas phycosphaerae]MBY4892833.1 response regulator [Gymnodinialimonas phycosphaerae]